MTAISSGSYTQDNPCRNCCLPPRNTDFGAVDWENTIRGRASGSDGLGGCNYGWAVQAQTPLSAYVDANGYLDVQTLTCAQLGGTYQQDANSLTTWYSGWYNGLAESISWICRKERDRARGHFVLQKHIPITEDHRGDRRYFQG